jgi:preprotein translocase subunit SecA
VEAHFALHAPEGIHPEEWDLAQFKPWFEECFRTSLSLPEGAALQALHRDDFLRSLLKKAEEAYEAHEAKVGREAMRSVERHVVLDAIDTLWKEHLLAMDHLKEGIGLRAYGQKDPLIEYKREGYEMFARMMAFIKEQVVPVLLRIEQAREDDEEAPDFDMEFRGLQESRPEFNLGSAPSAEAAPQNNSQAPKAAIQPIKRDLPKVGRNDLCPCGSGKKYKKCHGQAS